MAKIMKLKILLALCALCLGGNAFAQLTPFDTTTPHTNYSQSASGSVIWIAGVATNAAYTAVNSNGITTGDSLTVTQLKQGTNNGVLLGLINANGTWMSNNVVPQNALVVSLATNLWGGTSNYLGTVQGVWSFALTSTTNYTTPLLYWKSTVITTSDTPATLTWLTNSANHTVTTGYCALYGNITNGSFGAPFSLNINSNLFYSGTTAPGLLNLGAVTNISSWSIVMTNSYSPSLLYVSGDDTNFWQLPAGYQTTNRLYVSLVSSGTNPPGGLQSLTIYNVSNQAAIGAQWQYHGEDFTLRSLTVEGNLYGAAANQISSNTVAISNLLVTLATVQAQIALLTNGVTTNFSYVSGTTLSLTNHTATFTNGVFEGTSP